MKDINSELTELLNHACAENDSNTPDFILAEYMLSCLEAFNATITKRAEWYGRIDDFGPGPKS